MVVLESQGAEAKVNLFQVPFQDVRGRDGMGFSLSHGSSPRPESSESCCHPVDNLLVLKIAGGTDDNATRPIALFEILVNLIPAEGLNEV